MSDLRPEWIEKAARTLFDHCHAKGSRWDTEVEEYREVVRREARAVLNAVVDDIRRTPVVDQEALAAHCLVTPVQCACGERLSAGWSVNRDEWAGHVLAAMGWRDAADVRRAERERVAEEIAAAIADQVGSTSYRDAAFQQAVRIAREVGGRDE